MLASLALIVPLWQRRGRQSISRSALNKQLYRQRLLEMRVRREQGMLAESPESLVETAAQPAGRHPGDGADRQRQQEPDLDPGIAGAAGGGERRPLRQARRLAGEVSRWQDASSQAGELQQPASWVEQDARK